MKTRSKFAILALAIACSSCTKATGETEQHSAPVQDDGKAAKIAELEGKLQAIKDKEDADARLAQYTLNMMYISPKTVKELSPARMNVLAKTIVRVADDIFDNDSQKRDFVMVLQIESGFLKYAQSPTGPKGLAQLARLTFHEALAACGVKDVKDDDVWETDLNLYAGACYFKQQLMDPRFKGEGRFAIIAYNQGPEAKDATTYPKSGWLTGLEPLKYQARYSFLDVAVTDEKMPGVPAIADMPKPTAKHKTGNLGKIH